MLDERGLAIVSSVPGVGAVNAASILAELGDVSRFSNEKQVAAWCGLVPSVSQSAGRVVLGSITKRGSRWLRRTMVEAAHGAVRFRGSRFRGSRFRGSRFRGSRFREMFLRISAKKGKGTAYVAVARKLLGIICNVMNLRK